MNKAFRNILQEEHLLEEMKREQHNYQNKVAKLQKQLESVRKKGDPNKLQVLETETSAVSHISYRVLRDVFAPINNMVLLCIRHFELRALPCVCIHTLANVLMCVCGTICICVYIHALRPIACMCII